MRHCCHVLAGTYQLFVCIRKALETGYFYTEGCCLLRLKKEKKNWLVDLHLDSSNHLDTPHYETGYKLIHLNPETSASF